MTSYRENSCRFLPWSCSFLFCLKDFLPRLQMMEFLLRWRSCSCFSLFYFMAVLLKSGLHCFLKASSLVIMVSTFSESVRQWKPWSAKLVYSTLFAPNKSWDNCVPLWRLIQSTCTLSSKTILPPWMQSISSKTEGPIINDKILKIPYLWRKILIYFTKKRISSITFFFMFLFISNPGLDNIILHYKELLLTIWFWMNMNIFFRKQYSM